MKRFINSTGDQPPDFYISATTTALNEYMKELEDAFSQRRLLVTGVTVLPFSPPITTPVASLLGYFVPSHVRLSEDEVKSALWCGDPSMSFVNLFALFGRKMSANFARVSASPKSVAESQSAVSTPYVCNGVGAVSMTNAHYATVAAQMNNVVRALGTALTPERFMDIESRYLRLAVASTPVCPAFLSGLCLSTNGIAVDGAFTGTLEASFAAAPV